MNFHVNCACFKASLFFFPRKFSLTVLHSLLSVCRVKGKMVFMPNFMLNPTYNLATHMFVNHMFLHQPIQTVQVIDVRQVHDGMHDPYRSLLYFFFLRSNWFMGGHWGVSYYKMYQLQFGGWGDVGEKSSHLREEGTFSSIYGTILEMYSICIYPHLFQSFPSHACGSQVYDKHLPSGNPTLVLSR